MLLKIGDKKCKWLESTVTIPWFEQEPVLEVMIAEDAALASSQPHIAGILCIRYLYFLPAAISYNAKSSANLVL